MSRNSIFICYYKCCYYTYHCEGVQWRNNWYLYLWLQPSNKITENKCSVSVSLWRKRLGVGRLFRQHWFWIQVLKRLCRHWRKRKKFKGKNEFAQQRSWPCCEYLKTCLKYFFYCFDFDNIEEFNIFLILKKILENTRNFKWIRLSYWLTSF